MGLGVERIVDFGRSRARAYRSGDTRVVKDLSEKPASLRELIEFNPI